MVELSDPTSPLVRVMKRTGRDMLRSLGEKVRDGKMSEEFIRGKLEEFAAAFTWANAASTVAGELPADTEVDAETADAESQSEELIPDRWQEIAVVPER